ncbi:hypothetical protein HETIRDRAFT_452908 [Heterobasidion irregulare TC 32-1]|uniref:Uncharacterized protein n=1 Tax=Heterobasidion irregulare (strain TC 32-1) TaxID=747525 RepID=W4K1Z8_HETIT|nr:uncharacterized protein HETIRDRAFT_452908 [Heterobasidion irregulare TC 32-1]ETW79833.1 hypothetical protein HETIRDRAFT_452908 [Heterobasidion irregulare TC 32-1]
MAASPALVQSPPASFPFFPSRFICALAIYFSRVPDIVGYALYWRSSTARLMSTSAPTDLELLATVKLVHIFGGIFIWEFVTSVGFEWNVYMRKRPWRRSMGVYVACRITTLIAVVIAFVGFNVSSEVSCEVNALYIFSSLLRLSKYSSVYLGSAYAYRDGCAASLSSHTAHSRSRRSSSSFAGTVAIWGRHKLVLAFTVAVWLTNVAFALYSIQQAEAHWTGDSCVARNTAQMRSGVIANLATDVVLLAVMFAGVLHKRNSTALWRVLFVQGIAWISLALLTEVPAAVLNCLNISDAWNFMFQIPHLTVMAIVATTVYRRLSLFIAPLRRPHSIHRNLTAPNRYAPNRARARRAAAARSSTQSIPQTPRTPVDIPVGPLGVSGYGYNTQGGFGEDEERGVDVIVLE